MSTDLPQQRTIDQYTADGVATTYNYGYQILLSTDIAVYITLSGQTPNPINDLQSPSVYTVTNVGNLTGGTVVFNTAPLISSTVTLQRNMQISIDTDFSTAQNFNGQNLDNAFQRVVLIMQQLSTFYQQLGLQYITDSYLPYISPSPTPYPTNQLPTLGNQEIWIGSSSGLISTETLVEGEDVSVLRSELANNAQNVDGAGLVGFYDTTRTIGTTVRDYLNYNNIDAVDTSGAANTILASAANSYSSYRSNTSIFIKVAHSNTGSTSINVNSLGAKTIQKITSSGLVNLTGGEMFQNGYYLFSYNGTNFVILNPNQTALDTQSYVASVSLITNPMTLGQGQANYQKISPDTVDYDNHSMWDSTNHRFSPSLAGIYRFNCITTLTPTGGGWTGGGVFIAFFKNGSLFKVVNEVFIPSGVNTLTNSANLLMSLNGTDYVELFGWVPGTDGSDMYVQNGATLFSFQAEFIGSA